MDSTPFNMCFLSVTAAASTMVVSVVSKLSKVAKWTGHTGSFYHRSPSHRHNRSHNQSKCRNDVPTYSHNKQCKCLDPKAGSSCEDKRKFQNYKGDGNCNDENKWVLCRHWMVECFSWCVSPRLIKCRACMPATAVAITMAAIAVPRPSKGHSEDKVLVCLLTIISSNLCGHTMDS